MNKISFRAVVLMSIILMAGTVKSQENRIGIHQLQAQEMSESMVVVSKKANDVPIISIKKEALATKELGRVVFGFLPDWEYNSGAQNNMQYDALTHIAVSFFEIDANGNVSNPSNWPWTDVINSAHVEGTKVIMTVSNFGITNSELSIILNGTTEKNNFFNNVKSIISTYNLDGVNIDFEAFNSSDRGDVINLFMADLRDFIHSELPGKEVSFDGPAINWSGWNFGELVNAVDHLFVMSYDYNQGGIADPVAPLYPGSWAYCVDRTITKDYGVAVSNSSEKIILGVAYYGRKWKTFDGNLYSTIISNISSTRYASDISPYETYGRIWDINSHTPWYKYQSNGEWYQVYSDDEGSLAEKYDYALDKNLGGVGIWALNYDRDRPELWNLIRDKFQGIPTLSISNKFDIRVKAYPNPINDILNIEVESKDVEITIVSILGDVVYHGKSKNIDSSNWNKGLYIVNIKSRGVNKIIKVVK